jgi:hypothetical protein
MRLRHSAVCDSWVSEQVISVGRDLPDMPRNETLSDRGDIELG